MGFRPIFRRKDVLKPLVYGNKKCHNLHIRSVLGIKDIKRVFIDIL